MTKELEMQTRKRPGRVLKIAESMLCSMIPELYDSSDGYDDLFDIKHVFGNDHLLIDVYSKDRGTAGRLIGRSGATVKTIRRLLEIIANQEGLRVTFDVIAPK